MRQKREVGTYIEMTEADTHRDAIDCHQNILGKEIRQEGQDEREDKSTGKQHGRTSLEILFEVIAAAVISQAEIEHCPKDKSTYSDSYPRKYPRVGQRNGSSKPSERKPAS